MCKRDDDEMVWIMYLVEEGIDFGVSINITATIKMMLQDVEAVEIKVEDGEVIFPQLG